MKLKKVRFFMLIWIALFSFVPFSYAETSVVNLCENSDIHHSMRPRINDGKVVWAGYADDDLDDSAIFFWDGVRENRPVNLCENQNIHYYYDPPIGNPQIDENGYVVLTGASSNGESSDGHDKYYHEIFFWDGVREYSPENLSKRYSLDEGFDLQIDDGKVVWRAKVDGQFAIFYWDSILRDLPPKNLSEGHSTYNYNPQIDNGKVVWSGYDDDHDYAIFFGDGNPVNLKFRAPLASNSTIKN